MHSRVARVMLVAVLMIAGVGAGIQLRFLLGHSRQLADDHRQLVMQLGQFDARLADLTTAQIPRKGGGEKRFTSRPPG